MNKTNYGYSKTVSFDLDTAVKKISSALKEQGFGILSTIDVKATIKKKLNKDMEYYVILGACNPPSAYKVLQEETEIGLLLPCNVIVYNKDDRTHVAVIRPVRAMSIIKNLKLKKIALGIEEKLRAALNSI